MKKKKKMMMTMIYIIIIIILIIIVVKHLSCLGNDCHACGLMLIHGCAGQGGLELFGSREVEKVCESSCLVLTAEPPPFHSGSGAVFRFSACGFGAAYVAPLTLT